MKLTIALVATLMLGSCVSGFGTIDTQEEYVKALQRRVERRLEIDVKKYASFDCKVYVTQDDSGKVTSFEPLECQDQKMLTSAFERAIEDASPFPLPDNMELFDSDLAFRFCRRCTADD